MNAGRREDKDTTETANDESSFRKWSAVQISDMEL